MTRRSTRSERGAALVEMAVVLPLFLILVFGVMEVSWAFAQLNDAHHGVREGARLAAVNYDDDLTIGPDVLDEMCSRMGLAAANATVTLTVTDPSTAERGDTGNSAVVVNYKSLTGFLDPIFNPQTLSSDADFLLEQPLDGSGVAWTGTKVCSP